MKFKRILALAVSLAMILSIVPAFEFTASAADDEVVLVDTTTFTISGENTLSAVDGWTSSESNASVKWNQNWGNNAGTWGSTGTYALMFFYSASRGTNDGSATASMTDTSKSIGAGKISIDFYFACQEASNLYQRWNFNDADGNCFATLYFDVNVGANVGTNETTIASSSSEALALRGTEINITAEKNDEGTYTVTYTVAGNTVATETVESVNGFGSISASVPKWNNQWAAAGLQSLKITASDFPEASTAASVKKALVEVNPPELTKGDLSLATKVTDEFGTELPVTWTSSNEDVLSANGEYKAPENVTAVTLTASAEFNGETVTNSKTVYVLPKALAGGEYTDEDGLLYSIGDSIISLNTLTVASDKNNTKLVDSTDWTKTTEGDVTYVTTTSGGGSGAVGAARNTLNLEENTKYLIALTSKNLPSGGYTALWTGTSTSSSVYDFAGTSDWTRNVGVYDSSNGATVDLVLAWLNSNSTSIESIEVCPLTAVEAVVTVNYVAGDVTLKTETASAQAGASYTVEDIPVTIKYDGTTYVPDTANDTLTNTLSKGENVFTVSYKEGTIADTTLSESFKTRVNVLPILPTEVEASLEGSTETITVSVLWDYPEADEFKAVGDIVAVTGTVVGGTAKITANVTVVDKDYYLLAHYEFEGDGENSANEGTYTADVGSGVSFVDGGVYGKAVSLPGGSKNLDNAIQLQGDIYSDEKIASSKSMTITAFVKKDSANTGSWSRLFDFGYNNGGSGQTGDFFLDVKNFKVQIEGKGSAAASSTLESDEWHSVATTIEYVSDSEWTAHLYDNGEEVATGTFTDYFAAVENATYYIGASHWSDSNFAGLMDDFKIYSVALTADEIKAICAKQAVSVKYILNDATVATGEEEGFDGQTITLPAVVTGSNGSSYAPINRSYTVINGVSTAEVEVESTTVTASADDVAISVIGTNTPLLPEKVEVSYSDETAEYCPVTWDGYTGTVTTKVGSLTISATVTILDETFSLSDMTQGTGKQSFPTSIGDEFNMEFDYTPVNATNNWIYISKDGALWGSGQVGLGTGTDSTNGKFKFQPEADSETKAVTSGETYRIFLTIRPSAEGATYDAVMYNSDGTIFKSVENYAFRTSSDTINSIYTTNNGQGGTFTISNIKVYAPSVADQLTEYTVKFEGVDREDETVYYVASTINALPANAYLPDYKIPAIEGYVFEDYSLSGTTYTLTYVNADEQDEYSTYVHDAYSKINPKIGVMNLLGAHDAFTAKMSTVGDAAAAMGDDSGSKVAITSSSYVSASKAQSEGAFGLLNAGVRYFDVRLTASDSTETVNVGSIITNNKTAKGTNGEYYTTHAYISQPFKTILYTIRDFARENKGEIIILDFQEIYNSIGSLTGGHDNSSWDAAWSMVTSTGVSDYVYFSSTKLSELDYNTVTSNGTKSAVILIGKPGSQNTQSSHFFKGGDRDNSSSDSTSNIYSYWQSSLSSYSALTSDIANNQVANAPSSGRIKVMQAMYGSGSDNLISNAKTTNPKLITESNFETWLSTLPIVMLDDAAVNSAAYIELFKSYVKTYTIQYASDDKVIKSYKEQFATGDSVLTTPESDAYYFEGDDGEYYIIKTEAKTYTTADADENDVISVPVTIVHENAAVSDVFANADGSADCNNTDNLVFVGTNNDAASTTDADGEKTSNLSQGTGLLGGQRVGLISFKVPDVSENQAVTLNTFVASVHSNLGNGNWMKVAVNPMSGKVVDSGSEYVGYKASDYKYSDDEAIWSESTAVCGSGSGLVAFNNWMKFDVTEAVQAAKANGDEYITFKFYTPHAGVFIADREKAVAGGKYEGKAAYLEVSEGSVIDVSGAESITKNGGKIDSATKVVVADGSYISLTASDDTMAFVTEGELLVPDSNGKVKVTSPTENVAKATFDISMTDGAQVRIGTGVAGSAIPKDSGLRFIATVDNSKLTGIAGLAGLENEDVEFGVAISAEGSAEGKEPTYIRCEKYQDNDDENTVFTAVITNLYKNNYNRIFTATPYVKVGDKTYLGTDFDENNKTERSIYQVSAGLLASQEEDNPLAAYVKSVLNAYINNVGIRLTYSNAEKSFAERTSGSGAYRGDVFFEVESEANNDGTYTVTVKLENWDGLKLSDDWKDNIRVNNNNSAVQKMISNEELSSDGTTLTFEFNPNANTTDK